MPDYIVIGAGSAGCAMARRLSDDPGASVVLLEAGGRDDHPDIFEPTRYFGLWGSEIDWGYVSEPQPGTDGRVHLCPRGKVLGGTSSINGMVYLRGAREDYDSWAYAGNVGWDWRSVDGSFRRMEWGEDGRGGPLRPAVLEPVNPLSATFVDAAIEVGHRRNHDFNSGDLEGAGWNRSTIYQKRRQSAAEAFLAPVAGRPNLEVRTVAHARRLLLEGTRVVGVEYVDADGRQAALHGGEVVVCCGAYDSPKLLLLSGIGPADELERVGVAVRHELPGVGRNLIDHVLVGVVYAATRQPPATHQFVTETCLFARSDPRRLSCDIEISFAKERNFAEGYDAPELCYTIIPGIVRPQSRGAVTLRSARPEDPPVIDPQHLAEEADIAAMVRGIELTREIGAADAFADWRIREVVPGPQADDDAALRRYVRSATSTWFHPVGTCRMGIRSDCVVDPGLRVHGLQGLRVADASIMPDIVSVNTNAASMMIGWRGAEIILGAGAPEPVAEAVA